jgi:hypothetical protein
MHIPTKYNGLIFAAFGIWNLSASMHAYWQRHQAQNWLSVPAQIVSSSVQTEYAKFGTHYVAGVNYRYTLDGQSYSGSSIHFGTEPTGEEDANAQVAQFPAGAIVTAYVDPGDRRSAVLNRHSMGGATSWRLFSGILLVIGGAVFFLFARSREL